MMRLVAIVTTVAGLALAGCGSSTPQVEPEPAAASTLPADGQRYDPAIDPSGVPEGAWMCDMGTVHYAAPHEGECPVCGMALVQKK